MNRCITALFSVGMMSSAQSVELLNIDQEERAIQVIGGLASTERKTTLDLLGADSESKTTNITAKWVGVSYLSDDVKVGMMESRLESDVTDSVPTTRRIFSIGGYNKLYKGAKTYAEASIIDNSEEADADVINASFFFGNLQPKAGFEIGLAMNSYIGSELLEDYSAFLVKIGAKYNLNSTVSLSAGLSAQPTTEYTYKANGTRESYSSTEVELMAGFDLSESVDAVLRYAHISDKATIETADRFQFGEGTGKSSFFGLRLVANF